MGLGVTRVGTLKLGTSSIVAIFNAAATNTRITAIGDNRITAAGDQRASPGA